MPKRWSGLRIMFTLVALAALSAVIAAACGTTEVVREVEVPGETIVVTETVIEQVEVPGETIIVTETVVETVEIPVPMAMESAMTQDLSQTSDVPPSVQAVLDELGNL